MGGGVCQLVHTTWVMGSGFLVIWLPLWPEAMLWSTSKTAQLQFVRFPVQHVLVLVVLISIDRPYRHGGIMREQAPGHVKSPSPSMHAVTIHPHGRRCKTIQFWVSVVVSSPSARIFFYYFCTYFWLSDFYCGQNMSLLSIEDFVCREINSLFYFILYFWQTHKT